MTKHPKNVEGYSGSLEDLAKAIGNMQYSSIALLIEKLADDLKEQADADSKRGRKKLSQRLYNTAKNLNSAKEEMSEAWKISQPYMMYD